MCCKSIIMVDINDIGLYGWSNPSDSRFLIWILDKLCWEKNVYYFNEH